MSSIFFCLIEPEDPDATVEFPKAVGLGEPQAESRNVIHMDPSADEPDEPDDEDALCVQAASDSASSNCFNDFVHLSDSFSHTVSLQIYGGTSL